MSNPSYEKQLEEKLEVVSVDLETAQEFSDEMHDGLIEARLVLKEILETYDPSMTTLDELFLSERKMGTLSDTEYSALYLLQSCGSKIADTIETIEHTLNITGDEDYE